MGDGTSSPSFRDRMGALFPCFGQTPNKVLPQVAVSGDYEYIHVEPGRRLRVLHRVPPSPNCHSCPSSHGSDLSEEEYWFDSAAPNRLPVIQPQPSSQATQSRIINKFEPREVTTLGGLSLEEETISPGRLPRKKLIQGVVEDLDDEEDDIVNIEDNYNIDNETKPDIVDNDNTLGNERQFPVRNTLSPISDTPPLSPPRSPDHLPDPESCHPSPKLSHRSVSVVPDPDLDRETPATSVSISGGNLGGMANQGFQGDEEEEEEDSVATLVVEATNMFVNVVDSDNEITDAGYVRNRDLNLVLDSVGETTDNLKDEQEDIFVTKQGLHDTSQMERNSLPLLFFLHGVGGSSDIWRSQLTYFNSLGYEVVALDMLGHGFSSCPDKSKSYTFNKLFQDVLRVFDSYVAEPRQSIVFGHSYGCSFSVALARTRPDRVSTLVLVASGGPTPLAPPPNINRYPKCLMECTKHLLECKWRSQQQHKYNPRGKTMKFNMTFDIPGYVFKHVMAGQIWPEGDVSFHRRVSQPTLLVYGMRDTLVSLVEECEMERTLPKAYLELIPMGGHCVMLDTPEQFNVMAHRFIQKWKRNES